MARATGWAAAGVAAAVAMLGSALGCGDARAPSGTSANATAGCSSCHSGPGEAPPFRTPGGATDPSLPAIGAHDAHLHGDLSNRLGCAECHTVPRTVTDPGHLESSPDDLRFGALAAKGGLAPSYDPQTRTCAAVYCHGNFPGGNTSSSPRWTGGAAAGECGSCHGIPPQTGLHVRHVGAIFDRKSITCTTCHGDFVAATHVNGNMDVPLPAWSGASRTCAQACHGAKSWDTGGGG